MERYGSFATVLRGLAEGLRKPVLALAGVTITLMLAEAQQSVLPEIQVTTAPIPDFEFDSAR